MNSNDLAGLKTVLEAARIRNGVPGMSVAILYKGEIVFAEGFGKRNEHQPFTKETIAPIQSVTKAFTATAIGELVAEGKMDLDTTPVSTYLPEFQLKDPVLTSQLTLDDLLCHRTQTLSPGVEMSWFRTKEPRRELIKRLRHAEMPSKLPSSVNYSNIMYAVAGEAAANVAGIPYEQVVHDKIFVPLGLSSCGFSQSAMKRLPNHASPYYANTFEDAQNGVFQQQEYDEIYMADTPAGDIHTNVLDLLRWGKCVMDGGRVDGRQGHNYYAHSGSYPGSRAQLAIFPNDDLVIAQLANICYTQLLANIYPFIADMFLDLPITQNWLFDVSVKETAETYQLADAETEKALPPQIKDRPSYLPHTELVGEFESALYGRITVTTANVASHLKEQMDIDEDDKERGDLELRYNNLKSILEHYHFDAFKAVFSDLGETFVVLVSYKTGSDGHVSGLVLGFEEPVLFTKVKDAAHRI
ncbi:hypothetical protein EC991_000135 [Linnemannia zychae]|nr:hypothetical protein EC991_000135 [Linnemannia zychae]